MIIGMKFKHELIDFGTKMPIRIRINEADNYIVKKHWHADIEITYLLSGTIENVYIDGRNYRINEEDIFLVNSNCIHAVNVKEQKNSKCAIFIIPYNFIKDAYEDIDSITFDCMSFLGCSEAQKRNFNELKRILKEMISVFEEKDSLCNLQIKYLSYELLYVLIKYFARPKEKINYANDKGDFGRVSEICEYIKTNYNKKITVNSVAEKYHYSPQYLARYFKKYMGVTVHQYISHIRLENAYCDIVNTRKSVTFIALDNGFPNEKSFIRVFKENYDDTPDRFRKNYFGSEKGGSIDG